MFRNGTYDTICGQVDRFGYFAAWVGIIASILAIPFSIAANLLTPKLRNWWARKNQKRAERRVYILKRRFDWLLDLNKPSMRQIHYIAAIRYIVYLVAVFFYAIVLTIGLATQWLDTLFVHIAPTREAQRLVDGLVRYIAAGTYFVLLLVVVAVTFLFIRILKYLNLASERYLLQQQIEIQTQLSRLYEIAKIEVVSPGPAAVARQDIFPQTEGPKQPKLVRSSFGTIGMKIEAQQLGFDAPMAFAYFIQNSERRFETRAHNLRASISLSSAAGQEIKVDDAPWFQNTGNRQPHYHRTVTLGMMESAGIVCAISSDNKFYTAMFSDGERVKSGVELAYGQWTMRIHVEGDNVVCEYSGQLQVLPDRSIGFTPAGISGGTS